MILNDSNGRKVHSMFLSVCFFSAILFIQDLLRDLTEPAKNAKINKHRGQLTCPRAQPHFQIRLAPKFQDGAGSKRSELNFINSPDLSNKLERKSTCSIIELLLSEALPGYYLLKMTIVFVQVAFELELIREVNTGNILLPPVQNVKVSIY